MPHRLDGTWHSYVVVKNSPTTSVMAEDDLITDVRVNIDTGRIENGAHNGKPISGSVISVGSSFAVSMEHDLSLTFNSRYEGSLAIEDTPHGILVLTGTKRRVPKTFVKGEQPTSREREIERSAAAGQEDGTWVATKP